QRKGSGRESVSGLSWWGSMVRVPKRDSGGTDTVGKRAMLVQGERVWEGLRNVDGRAVFRTCRVSTGQIDDHRRAANTVVVGGSSARLAGVDRRRLLRVVHRSGREFLAVVASDRSVRVGRFRTGGGRFHVSVPGTPTLRPATGQGLPPG